MTIVLWVIAGLLACVFGSAGLMKVTQPKAKLMATGLAWVEDVNPSQVKAIGVLEILAALGLILPGMTGVATVLVPLAALGLVLVMLGAIVVHVRRREPQFIVMNFVLLAMAAVIVWGRFGPYSFS